MSDDPLAALGLIAFLGVGCQWLAAKVNIPGILILLATGILAGPVLGLFDPDELFGSELLFPAVSLGVGILLFEGGLALRTEEAREVGQPLLRLVTLGTAITWVVGSLAVGLLFDVTTAHAMLIGAVLVVSGPTVVLPLLRLVNVRPSSSSLLKWEGILIDPIGALLGVVVLEAVLGADSASEIAGRILLTLGAGAVIGAIIALALAEVLARHWVPDRLHNAVTFMLVIGAFALADQVQAEAGLTATTIMGIVLANQHRAPVAHIAEFEEDLGVVVLGALFIVLGARVDLDAVWEFLPRSLALLAVLVLVARPLAVLSMLGTSLPRRDMMFAAAMAPRGIVAAAVASLFAIELSEHGDPLPELVPAVFTVIIGTVVIYGLLSGFAARRLRVARAAPTGVALVGGSPWILDIAERLVDLGVPVLVVTSEEQRVEDAVMRELLVYAGRVDSEELIVAADAVGVSTVIALADNDDVNDLAMARFSEAVERAQLFHLPPGDGVEVESGSSKAVVGKRPFGDEITRQTIVERLNAGGQVRKVTRRPRSSESWLPLLVVDPNGTARIASEDESVDPGEHVIALMSRRAGVRRRLPG